MSPVKHIVRFVLDSRIVEIDFKNSANGLRPTTTVLNYLRSLSDHKGVKEGCAEGDCGACTVVLGEVVNGKMQYKAVTSCLLFLPMIHGKQLITIENLACQKNGKQTLHPVQQAIVDCYGTQCGYCTPGVVMSMFALYKNHSNPSREIIEDALTGNLCRCTGYQSIINAAEMASKNTEKDQFSESEPPIIELLNEINSDKRWLEIQTAVCHYFQPLTLNQALKIRLKYPEVIVINGATDTALRQTKKHESLNSILDLSRIAQLSHFSDNPDHLQVNSSISIEKLKTISVDYFPSLSQMLNVFGSLQIRNMATIGGNICSASPIGDILPVLIAYKAEVIVYNLQQIRILKFEEFIKGYRQTDIQKDELLVGVIIPKSTEGLIVKSYKISKRKNLDISTVSACFSLKLDANHVSEIILAFGGVAAFTKRAVKTEKFLTGKNWDQTIVEQAMSILYNEFQPIDDARANADTRKIMARNLLLKFFLETNNEQSK